ncbi:glycosyltransferase family protein [Priestia megaterium]|uniref:glycosyltransferase family protein n=1 Tax=Priestia megaterium TaxID=1404 RepID=UPI00203F2157|nr:glycosyltransferase [Priestia megaterium]MCM3100041.1 glycosyltransferase [Priestia megaterium]
MINLLFIAADTSNSLDKNFYFLEKELAKLTNLTIWRKSGRIDNILNKITTKPDYILLLNDIGSQMFPIIKGLFSINIPIGLIVNDVHRFTESRRHYIRKNNIQHIFSIVRDKFHEIYPEYKSKMEWFPHFVNTKVCKDYGLKKDINLLMIGAVNNFYPVRQKILQAYKEDPEFIYHHHPGYRNFKKDEENQIYIDEKYAKEINRSKIFFTCPSILNYPVKKYFQVLACKSLLLAPTFKELEDLGFIPDNHFISINEYNFKEKATYYLANETERKKIIEEGYRFIHYTHSIKIRAQQLVNKIENTLS